MGNAYRKFVIGVSWAGTESLSCFNGFVLFMPLMIAFSSVGMNLTLCFPSKKFKSMQNCPHDLSRTKLAQIRGSHFMDGQVDYPSLLFSFFLSFFTYFLLSRLPGKGKIIRRTNKIAQRNVNKGNQSNSTGKFFSIHQISPISPTHPRKRKDKKSP